MARKEMPIFTRTFDFLTWLLPVTNNFPRAQRFTVTARLLDAAFDLRERLEEANFWRGAARLERLDRADEALDKVRLYLRLAARPSPIILCPQPLKVPVSGTFQKGYFLLVPPPEACNPDPTEVTSRNRIFLRLDTICGFLMAKITRCGV